MTSWTSLFIPVSVVFGVAVVGLTGCAPMAGAEVPSGMVVSYPTPALFLVSPDAGVWVAAPVYMLDGDPDVEAGVRFSSLEEAVAWATGQEPEYEVRVVYPAGT